MVMSRVLRAVRGILAKCLPGLAMLGAHLGLASASADFLYVGRDDDTIRRIDVATRAETTFASARLHGPRGLAFDASGILYVANQLGTDSIVRFPAGGGASLFATSGLKDPDDLAFDAAGNLYVA